jgi:hypothetical protein
MGRIPQVAWRSVDGLVREAITHNVNQTNLSFNSYVARVMDHYSKTVPPEQRELEINDTGDIHDSLKRFANKLSRFINIDGDTNMPAGVVPSLIACLDEPWQHDCRTAVVNLISPERLQEPGTDAHPLDHVSDLVKEHTEALQAYLAIARDGFENDTPAQLQFAFTQLQQAGAVIDRIKSLVQSELEKKQAVLRAVK